MDLKCSYIYIYIYIERERENIGISKYEKQDFFVQVRNYLLPSSLKVFREKGERGTIFLFWFFHLPPPPPPSRAVPATRARELAKANRSRPVSSLNSTDFFKISQNPPRASGAWRHSHCVAPFPISGYCDISEWHVRSARARVNICVNAAPK